MVHCSRVALEQSATGVGKRPREPGGEALWRGQKFRLHLLHRLPAPVHYLSGVWSRLAREVPDKDMIQLVLGEAGCGIFRTVEKLPELRECHSETQFLGEPPLRRRERGFARAGMTTAGIGPEATKVVFFQRSLLEQQAIFIIEDKDRKRPVELPTVEMRGQFLAATNRVIVRIH